MKKTIEIEVYKDKYGRPTCAKSIYKKKCEFLLTSSRGMIHHCFYDVDSILERYDETDCFKPSDKCRLHNAPC